MKNQMKDKEKQIEEMAKRIHIATDLYYMECIKIATYLFEKDNCRIIGKDSVVLSKEDYESIRNSELNLDWKVDKKVKEELDRVEKQSSKETAEKFLNMLYWKAVKHIKGKNKDECFVEMSFEKLDKLAKQFGVEIKE